MFERFTEQARRVLVLATREAKFAGHTSVDTGDLLVGLAQEATGLAGRALAEMGVHAYDVGPANRSVPVQLDTEAELDDAMALEAKSALQTAAEHAVSLERADVDTGHLLLAILDLDGCRAIDVLVALPVAVGDLRDALLRRIKEGGRDGDPDRTSFRAGPSPVFRTLIEKWGDGLTAAEREELHATLETQDDTADPRRSWALLDWLVRSCTANWLLAAGLPARAAELERLDPIEGKAGAELAGEALDAAAAALSDTVPGALSPSTRSTAQTELRATRARSGETAAIAAATADLSDAVTTAAAEGVKRATAEMLRQGPLHNAGVWARAVSGARKAAEGERWMGRRGGDRAWPGRRGRTAPALWLCAPCAWPRDRRRSHSASWKPACGQRGASGRRIELEQGAARAALAACCTQLIDDAAWVLAGDTCSRAGSDAVDAIRNELDDVVRDPRSALLDLVRGFSPAI